MMRSCAFPDKRAWYKRHLFGPWAGFDPKRAKEGQGRKPDRMKSVTLLINRCNEAGAEFKNMSRSLLWTGSGAPFSMAMAVAPSRSIGEGACPNRGREKNVMIRNILKNGMKRS